MEIQPRHLIVSRSFFATVERHSDGPYMATTAIRRHSGAKVRLIPMSYNSEDSHTSALRLILAVQPQWEHTDGKIEFVRFTDGITNVLLKAINKRPGLSDEEIDNAAVLLRAYGKGTDLLIDREREVQNHDLLSRHGLAPPLLARFHNGMLYRFMRGTVTSPEDLRQERIWRAVARRLGQWHAVVPCLPPPRVALQEQINGSADFTVPAPTPSKKDPALQSVIDNVASGKPVPNLWSVMQKWIYALPCATASEQLRQAKLQKELTRLVDELSNRPGLGKNGLVFAHCDLLSGNVIAQAPGASGRNRDLSVNFIDYEYSTPSPAAFDIANHFAEWGGFDCDYNALPTRAQRRDFIAEYVHSYFAHAGRPIPAKEEEIEAEKLLDEVDLFRAVPGFYWGMWALIQATISQIDFDYAAYAEMRLNEYWAWREEVDGSRVAAGKEMTLREKRWAQEI